MRDLILGLSRYDDLRRSTGVTNATLSDRLKALEQNGLVERRQYQSRPDRHEYVPTSRGRDVAIVLQAMVQVGDQWNLAGLDGPPIRFVDRQTGRGVKLMLADAQTGQRISPREVAVELGPGADELTAWRLTRSQSSIEAGEPFEEPNNDRKARVERASATSVSTSRNTRSE